jgi:hypothetical protein
MFTFGSENIRAPDENSNIKYLYLGMRDLIDCDISYYAYSAINFIEDALKSN